MDPLLLSWLILTSIFLGLPAAYFLYLRRATHKPWNIRIDDSYSPSLTVIVPTHNEERTVEYKLRNLYRVNYPKEKVQIIIIDDSSTDQTMHIASVFANDHPELDVELINEKKRRGKSATLNLALKYARNDIVIVTDSDAFWASDILVKALPYLADPCVGAVVGRQKVLNAEQSWTTQGERVYLDMTFGIIRLGESKIHSTIVSHGGFAAYKRRSFNEFNLETDDSGTAFDIVQSGARILYVPEAVCFDISPVTWKGKVSTKIRRATQLVQIYGKCLRLLVKNQLSFPKRIAIPEIFLYLLNPFVFVLLSLATLVLTLIYLPYSLVLFLVLTLALLIPKSRLLLVEFAQNNCILLGALFVSLLGKKFTFWNTLEESRQVLTIDMLEREKLI